MNFTEETQKHFIKHAPSGKNPEGAFSVSKQKPLMSLKNINIIIWFIYEHMEIIYK